MARCFWRTCRATPPARFLRFVLLVLLHIAATNPLTVNRRAIRHWPLHFSLPSSPAIAHLAGTSVCMIIKNYYEAHASEKEKAVALLPKLGAAREAPLRLVKQLQVA